MSKPDNENIIALGDVRLSFPHLFEPKSFEDGGSERYSVSLLLDPSTKKGQENIRKIEAETKRVAEEKWGKGKIPKSLKTCLNDGNEKDYDGYENMMFVTASNTRKPTVAVRKDGANIRLEDDPEDLFHAGIYANVTVTLWAQDNSYGKRVNASLRMVMRLREGERFGAAPVDADSEAELFDDFDTEDDLI